MDLEIWCQSQEAIFSLSVHVCDLFAEHNHNLATLLREEELAPNGEVSTTIVRGVQVHRGGTLVVLGPCGLYARNLNRNGLCVSGLGGCRWSSPEGSANTSSFYIYFRYPGTGTGAYN